MWNCPPTGPRGAELGHQRMIDFHLKNKATRQYVQDSTLLAVLYVEDSGELSLLPVRLGVNWKQQCPRSMAGWSWEAVEKAGLTGDSSGEPKRRGHVGAHRERLTSW